MMDSIVKLYPAA